MKDQKQLIIDDILARINGSPFMLVADYTGLTVTDFGELRNRLRAAGSECHVVRNTYVKRAAKVAELPEELQELLAGQTAIVTGEEDICGAAKVLKNFAKEFSKTSVKAGVLDGKLLNSGQVTELASLPPREVLLAQFLGVLQAPATKLVRVLNEPASALARVLKAWQEQGGAGPGASAVPEVPEEAAPEAAAESGGPEATVKAEPEVEEKPAGEKPAAEAPVAEKPAVEAEAASEESPEAKEGGAGEEK